MLFLSLDFIALFDLDLGDFLLRDLPFDFPRFADLLLADAWLGFGALLRWSLRSGFSRLSSSAFLALAADRFDGLLSRGRCGALDGSPPRQRSDHATNYGADRPRYAPEDSPGGRSRGLFRDGWNLDVFRG